MQNNAKSLNYMHMMAKEFGSKRVPENLTEAIQVAKQTRVSKNKLMSSFSVVEKWNELAVEKDLEKVGRLKLKGKSAFHVHQELLDKKSFKFSAISETPSCKEICLSGTEPSVRES